MSALRNKNSVGSSFLGHLPPLARQAQSWDPQCWGAPKVLHLNLGFAADEKFSSNSSSISQGCGDTQQLDCWGKALLRMWRLDLRWCRGQRGLEGPLHPLQAGHKRGCSLQDQSGQPGSIFPSLQLWMQWREEGKAAFGGVQHILPVLPFWGELSSSS